MRKGCDHKGDVGKNKFGTKMIIIKFNNQSDIWVEFQDEYKHKKHTNYQAFLKGEVKNPYDKNIYNVGYLGVGKYSHKTHSKIYDVWNKMLKRCYDVCSISKYPTYKDCYVCDEWLCFQNFAKWYEENYYGIKDEKMCLDKDILVKGNKIYSPETCIFVPNRINLLFLKRQNKRGDLPIGCTSKSKNRIHVTCNCNSGSEHIKYFNLDEPFRAFTCYKNFKENYIKEVADEYKGLIPEKLYNAMYNYKIEIND